MSADLDSLVGTGTAAESASLASALGALTPQTFDARLAKRTTTRLPINPGVSYVASVSLIQAITNTSRQNAEKHWANIKKDSGIANSDGSSGCSFRFPGQRGPMTDVIDTTTALQVIMALPGKTAAQFRLKASVLLVRFLCGDLSLVAEIYGARKLQKFLAENDPGNPLARLAQTAEAQGLLGDGPSLPDGAPSSNPFPQGEITPAIVPARASPPKAGVETLICLRGTLLNMGVAKELLRPYASDVANALLSLKCKRTHGEFNKTKITRRCKAHKYIPEDGELVEQAVRSTYGLYQKRARDLHDNVNLSSQRLEKRLKFVFV